MKKLLLLTILGFIFLIGCTYQTPNQGNDNDNYPVSMFDLQKSYKGSNSWTFTITADMPTPCHSMRVGDVLVAESYPEQVTIEVVVTEPSDDTACAQVIDTQTVNGAFSASEGATTSIKVKVE